MLLGWGCGGRWVAFRCVLGHLCRILHVLCMIFGCEIFGRVLSKVSNKGVFLRMNERFNV